MGKQYSAIDGRLADFIKAQKVFFVATAPLSADGHVNISPKGYDSLAILEPHKIAWLDIGGSGIETLAHLKENARMTIMFCAFEGPANILRLYGKGRAIQFDEPEFSGLLGFFPNFDKARAIITMDITRISDSCGWGVPYYDYKSERDQLKRYANNPQKSTDDWAEKYYTQNAKSVDGLTGIERKNL